MKYILDNHLQVGGSIPSIRQLQTIFLLSKYAVMDILKALCDEGILEKGEFARNGYRVATLPDSAAAGGDDSRITAQFILPFNSWNYVGNHLLSRVEKVFASHNCNLLFSNNTNSPIVEHQLLQNIITSSSASKPDALLLVPSCSINNPNIELLRMIQEKMPVVLMDRIIFGFDSFYVGLNNRNAGQHAAGRLWEKGHRVFAFVGGFSNISPIQDRMQGFASALQAKQVPEEHRHIILNEALDVGGYHKIKPQIDEVAAEILRLSPRPTAIVCGSDRLATCLVSFFAQQGLSIPQDIAVIGCDNDITISSLSPVPLTTYSHPYREMANAVFQLVSELYQTPSAPYRQIEFLPEFVPRKSG